MASNVWKLRVIVQKFIADNQYWEWRPKWIKRDRWGDDIAGVYLIRYPEEKGYKVGMSTRCIKRVDEQGGDLAYLLMSMDDCRDLVGDELVDEIIELQLPGLHVHEDHEEKIRALIRLQLVEALAANTLFACKTNTTLERLTQLPSKKVLDTMKPLTIDKKLIEEFRYEAVHILGTWITLRSEMLTVLGSDFLQNKLHPPPKDAAGFVKLNRWIQLFEPYYLSFDDCLIKSPRSYELDFIVKHLEPPNLTKEDILTALKPIQKKEQKSSPTTNDIYIDIYNEDDDDHRHEYGDDYDEEYGEDYDEDYNNDEEENDNNENDGDDNLDVEGESDYITDLVDQNNYYHSLTADDATRSIKANIAIDQYDDIEDYQRVTGNIRLKYFGYSHHVYPKKGAMAAVAMRKLRKLIEEESEGDLICLENCHIIDMLQNKKGRRWLDTWLPGWNDKNKEIVHGLRVVKSKNNHHVLITCSFHLMFSDNTSIDNVIFPVVRAFIAALELLYQTQKITATHYHYQRNILQSFLMAIDGKDVVKVKDRLGFYAGRRRAMPKDYFRAAPVRTLVVSKRLGIGYLEMLYIREKLRKVKFQEILKILGLGGGEDQTSNPIELDFQCTGVHNISLAKETECKLKPDTTKKDTPVWMITDTTNPQNKRFVCHKCARVSLACKRCFEKSRFYYGLCRRCLRESDLFPKCRICNKVGITRGAGGLCEGCNATWFCIRCGINKPRTIGKGLCGYCDPDYVCITPGCGQKPGWSLYRGLCVACWKAAGGTYPKCSRCNARPPHNVGGLCNDCFTIVTGKKPKQYRELLPFCVRCKFYKARRGGNLCRECILMEENNTSPRRRSI